MLSIYITEMEKSWWHVVVVDADNSARVFDEESLDDALSTIRSEMVPSDASEPQSVDVR